MSQTQDRNAEESLQPPCWDERYRTAEAAPLPARVLTDWAHLLPPSGRALDLACGLGGNALWLAERGFRVSAWDSSAVAIARLTALARERRLPVEAEARDVVARPPEPGRFDLIVVAHFLERSLAPAIAAALSPGGVLLYQTFTREQVTERGPATPAYRLAPNELLGLFAGLRVRAFRDEGRLGDTGQGLRDLTQLVAQRTD